MPSESKTGRCPQCGKSFPTNVKICPDDGTVLEHDASTTELGKVLDGKYRLDDFLSHGGMGAVYKATHVMLGKTVAVKLINPELVTSPDVVRRFQREARAATALNHPNIVAVYDLGQTSEGTLYIAMEFVNGPNLKTVITTGGPLSPIRTIALMRQVVSALSAAHRAKIIHRDLKPHNIMIARGDAAEEIAKLVDFGIAKTFDEATQLTMAGDAIGTPHYMAPEQAAGRAVDARCDLYSVGVILYEMLTGDVPFNDSSAPAILIKHLQEPPQKPSLKNPNVTIPPELEAIALRCLEKDPAARFQTADELAAALERAAATIPGAALAMQAQATLPMGAAAAAAPADSWGAATLPASAAAATPSAAPGAPAQTARVPQAAPQAPVKTQARPANSHDTRSTAIPSAIAAAPAPKASKAPLVLVGLFIVVGLAGAAWLHMKQSAPADQTVATSTTAASEPPAASPAMATQTPATTSPAPEAPSSQPAAAPPPPATATPAAVSAAVAASTSSPAKVAASPSTTQVASAKPTAAAPAATSAASASAPSSASSPAAAVKAAAPAAQAPATMPANPAVFFHCTGAPEVCSPLRTAVNDALEKGGLTSVGAPARADIDVAATVEILQEQVNRQFGTTFAVRNYSIDVSGQALRTSEVVAMPPNATLSFDPQVGSERAAEKARLVASDIVDRVKAFARKKQGG